MRLRPYQIEAIDRLTGDHPDRSKRHLLCIPTGGGKTVIAAEIIRRTVESGRRVLFIAHRRELIHQCAAKLRDAGVSDYGIILAGYRPDTSAMVQIASIQTLTRRACPPADLIIIDEAHRSAATSYRSMLLNYPLARVIGLTATPQRLDGKGLDDIYEALVMVAGISDLVATGFLVSPDCYAKPMGDALRGLRVRCGDYAENDLARAMDKPRLIGDIVHNWQRIAPGARTIAFASGIEHAKHIAGQFSAHGVPAVHIAGAMPVSERDEIIAAWRGGTIKVVVNCQLLVEGFDFPELECCILARPTKSTTVYLQSIGRIMRPAPGKTRAIIIDHAGCIGEHGLPASEREWSLAGTASKRKNKLSHNICRLCEFVYLDPPVLFLNSRPLHICPRCRNAACVSCGHYFVPVLGSEPSMDGIATTVIAECPACAAEYTDDKLHIKSSKNTEAIPATETCDLQKIESSVADMSFALRVKIKYKQYLREAEYRGYKKGWAFYKIKSEFGDKGTFALRAKNKK